MISCHRSAVFTEDGKHRLCLMREGMDCLSSKRKGARIVFILNNPSTAGADTEDATSRKGLMFTAHWGYQNMWFVNSNPACSTDPKQAWIPSEEVLEQNDYWIRTACSGASGVVAAWGADADSQLAQRALKIARSVKTVYALRVNKDGTPGHILYLPKDLRPVIYNQETA